jgi:Xaa-Pro aminopeptidase
MRKSQEEIENIRRAARQFDNGDLEFAEGISAAIRESELTGRDVDEILQERRSAKRA